jgi:asparagine synthase (glutamine-hydrolysing)
MCGICGVVHPAGSGRRVDADALERMRDTLFHRGPDGAGTHLDELVGLGHRRLSIVDVAHGAQPMYSADRRYVLVYNGEIYNHPDLMARLQSSGVKYSTHCDTETVLHLFERDRARAVQQLRGMFAIGLWDAQQRELVLARDRFGVKPVYYVHGSDGSLWFASEIKALLAAGAVKPRMNRNALPDYLANHAPSGNETLFEGVMRLPPGHTLTWRDGQVTIERYWELPAGEQPHDGRSDADLVDEYRERFREAVRMRLMADVPLGMFLSGGIDSAAITAMMASLVDEPIRTFSVAFAEREANELHYARLVADRYRTDHREIVVKPRDFWDAVPRLVWHEDEPMAHPSSVALNFVSRLAAAHVKVVLTGEGSDETLAGYNRYRVTLANLALGGAWEAVAPRAIRSAVRERVLKLAPAGAAGRRLRRTFLAMPADLDALYFDNFAVFGRGWQSRLLAPGLREELASINPYAAFHEGIRRAGDAPMLAKLLHADIATYLHELLMKQDQMSMAASIESRVPFLDHPLAEFAAGLPQRLRLRGATTKVVLRRAMKDLLPPEILSRRKMGFPVPVGAWLRGPYRHMLDEYVTGNRALERGLFDAAVVRSMVESHVSGEADHSERLWSLINLEIWQRIFLEGEEPAQVPAIEFGSSQTKMLAGAA